MAQEAFPFDAAPVTEDDWRLMAREWLTTGVLRDKDDELEVFADSTGMQVKVRTGRAWMEGHYYRSTAQETLAIAEADPSNPRIDRVVLRADFVANTIQLAVLTGVPGAVPAAPALTQTDDDTWEISLAQVDVATAASTIEAGDVTDERDFAAAANAVPVGTLSMFGGAEAPTGWLLARGQAVSRTDFAALFAAIGTTYGAGDGATTFNLPDLQQRFPLGKAAAGTGDVLGVTGGEINHDHTIAHTHSTPDHKHDLEGFTAPPSDTIEVQSGAGTTVSGLGHDHALFDTGSVPEAGAASDGAGVTGAPSTPDSGTNNPPFVTVNFIVKT